MIDKKIYQNILRAYDTQNDLTVPRNSRFMWVKSCMPVFCISNADPKKNDINLSDF